MTRPAIRKHAATIGIAAYLVVGFLTFGYGANRQCDWEIGVGWNAGCNFADAVALPLSVLWPIYWAGRASMEVTK